MYLQMGDRYGLRDECEACGCGFNTEMFENDGERILPGVQKLSGEDPADLQVIECSGD